MRVYYIIEMRIVTIIAVIAALCLCTSCVEKALPEKCYNEGINIIPAPASLTVEAGKFKLSPSTSFCVSSSEARVVAEFFASKLKGSTGFALPVMEEAKNGCISLSIDATLDLNEEGYQLRMTPDKVNILAKTAKGAFYGMQTFMQLLPAEVESPSEVEGVAWEAPCVSVDDAPRFAYRGFMLDPCRHFIPVENVKKHLDVLSLFKINTMHWHLTDDQGWRIEIKKYPKLTEVGSVRMEGEGVEHSGYYTQEQIKEIVAYASERFITIIPELELPGHELAAIAAYPELSCRGETVKPRIIWGVEDVVMCPGKEGMFTFLEEVIAEMVPLFPGTYFHIGGDECPKTSWKSCPACQARIKAEGLKADKRHTAEEYLQSYVVRRMEKVLKQYGKRIIGWDEILEGGLSPEATVMSWRGEIGGIEAASQNHDVIMTSHGNGMYLDQYQGDPKIEPVAIGGYTSLERVYGYNPVPDTLVAMGKARYVKGVQCNNWSEYMYTPHIMEYRMYPRALALAEIAWTPLAVKDYKDFERRINNAYVRLDGHDVNYHIPQPEQLYGSCNFVAFTDSALLEFSTSRPVKMVYTLDGSEPSASSAEYVSPISVSENTTLRIRTLLPSGKMSPVRTIVIEKQTLAPACEVREMSPGLKVRMCDGMYLKVSQLDSVTDWKELTINNLHALSALNGGEIYKNTALPHAAIATGYVEIPADGVYFFTSNNEEVWVDGKRIISNEGEVKLFSRRDTSIALAKGLHELKVVFLGHIIGGWPSWWDNADVAIRRTDWKEFKSVSPEQIFY